MIGIGGIASYIPSHSIDNIAQATKFGETSEFIENKIGALFLPTIGQGTETSDLAVQAVRNLCVEENLDQSKIDALIVVTQNPDGQGLPHTAAIVQHKLGLSSEVAAFDISLGCSGFVYGLSVMQGLMAQAGLNYGVLVTADPYSKIVNRADRVTSLLFGDAATATLVTREAAWTFRKPILETDGSGANSLYVDGHKQLHMNGRHVFNFASQRVPRQIDRFLEREGLVPGDIDVFCLHQGSAAILDAISRRYPNERNRFLKDVRETGNTVSSSIPLLLKKYVLGQSFDRVLISGFGVGLSWATNLIERVKV